MDNRDGQFLLYDIWQHKTFSTFTLCGKCVRYWREKNLLLTWWLS